MLYTRLTLAVEDCARSQSSPDLNLARFVSERQKCYVELLATILTGIKARSGS
jgi:hypothetical protein